MILVDTLTSIIQQFLTKSYHFSEDSVLVESVNGKLLIFIDSNNICRRMYDNDQNTITAIHSQLQEYLYYYLYIEKGLFTILFY
jgi:hypothetical protein